MKTYYLKPEFDGRFRPMNLETYMTELVFGTEGTLNYIISSKYDCIVFYKPDKYKSDLTPYCSEKLTEMLDRYR